MEGFQTTEERNNKQTQNTYTDKKDTTHILYKHMLDTHTHTHTPQEL